MASASLHLSDTALLQLQRAGSEHIGISLTRACPLSCSHCAAATVPAAQHGAVSLRADLVDLFCGEMPALARRGIRAISLTGGEPVLALKDVARLSEAAHRAGIRTTLVTGLYWASGPASRRRVIAALPRIECWNLSWDRFHAPQVAIENVAAAVAEIRAAGGRVVMRVAVSDPETEADREVDRQIALHLAPVDVVKQPVRPVGRASAPAGAGDPADITPGPALVPGWPCLSTGPLVMADGSARPCCSSMIDEPDHPFHARSAGAGLVALHQAWSEDPLLLLLRAIGFGPVLRLLAEIDPDHPLNRGSGHPCDLCAGVFGDPDLGRRIAEKVRGETIAPLARAAAEQVFKADTAASGPALAGRAPATG